jgi:hypothetical protein
MGGNMKQKIVGIFVCLVLLVPIVIIDTTASKTETRLEGGWLEERSGIKILHASGSHYDMGYQQGYFLASEIGESQRAQLSAFEKMGYSYDKLLTIWNVMKDFLPDEYKDEMQGMADGSGMSFDDISVLTTMPAVFNVLAEDACCEISLWGDATLDGTLYHVRSLDWSLDVHDPVTGIPLYENIILIVRNPNVGYASLVPDFAGSIGCWNGINEQGIAVGENTCVTNDSTLYGICPWIRMRMVLDYASTSEEAIHILVTNRTCGTNFVLSDANRPMGYALDQTAHVSYVGTWDDPVEGIQPFWQIKDVVRRVPQYVNPQCAALEHHRFRYDPGGVVGFLLFVFQKSYMFVGWTHYKALSKEIEKRHGSLDLNGTMSLLRDEYVGNTNFVMRIIRETKFHGLQCLCQWVCSPETGDIVISFARNNTLACYNQVHYFNMFDLFHSDPPKPTKSMVSPRNNCY